MLAPLALQRPPRTGVNPRQKAPSKLDRCPILALGGAMEIDRLAGCSLLCKPLLASGVAQKQTRKFNPAAKAAI